jgi:small subunit ribosomal protein S14
MGKYLNLKDKIRRNKFSHFENERLRLKSLIYNRKLQKQIRWLYSIKLSSLPKDASQTRIKNRCLITNRGQSILRIFHLSRITFKEYIGLNYIAGIRKSSW